MKEYFVLNDLPDGTWSVCWPGYEDHVVDNPGKALKLLEILFEHVGVDEAMIGVIENRNEVGARTLYMKSELWLTQYGREHMARTLADYTIPGVRFRDVYEAEKFKLHMEQRLAWSRLGGAWA